MNEQMIYQKAPPAAGKAEELRPERVGTGTKRLAFRFVLWAVLLLLLVSAFLGVERLGQFYAGCDLRFSQPLNPATAQALRRHIVQSEAEEAFWPTFWNEGRETLASELAEAEAPCVFYAGRGEAVRPVEFLRGGWPGATDEAGCVLSDTLAARLWGGSDVVGKTLTIGGVQYTVRGVFWDTQESALVSTGDTQPNAAGGQAGWEKMTLSGGPAEADRADVENLFAAAGVPNAETIFVGWWVPFLARCLALVPLVIFGVVALILLLRALKGGPRMLVILALLLGLAALLTFFLELLPGRLLPGQWSDFSFWTALAEEAGESFRAFLALGDTATGQAGQGVVIGQVVVSVLLILWSGLVSWELVRKGPESA